MRIVTGTKFDDWYVFHPHRRLLSRPLTATKTSASSFPQSKPPPTPTSPSHSPPYPHIPFYLSPLPPKRPVPNSSTILPPLSHKKPQPAPLRLKRNHAPLRKEKHVALRRLDALPALVRDLKVTVNDDFHLVVGVGVDERGAWFEAVEAGGDGVVFAVTVGGKKVGG